MLAAMLTILAICILAWFLYGLLKPSDRGGYDHGRPPGIGLDGPPGIDPDARDSGCNHYSGLCGGRH